MSVPLDPYGATDLSPRRARVTALLLSFLAFAVVLAGIPSPLFDLDRHAVPKETLVHLAALVAGVAVLARRNSLGITTVERILLVLLLWTVVGAAAATNPWIGLRSAALTVSSVTLFLVARRVAPAGRRILLAGVLAALVFGGGTALAQAYGFDIGVLAESRAPGGTFGNRNFMAHALVIGFPVLVAASRVALGPVARWGALAGLLVSGGGILLSRSRAAWLAFLLASIILGIGFPWMRGRRSPGEPRPTGTRAATGAVVMGVLLALILPNQLSWRSDTPYRDTLGALTDYGSGSGRGRLIQYRTSLRLVPDDPLLGTGAGNWVVHYPRVTRPGDPGFAGADPIPTNPWPSSDWVALLVERGGVAVLLLLLAGAVFLRDTVRDGRHGNGVRAVTTLAVVGATLVVSLLDAVLQTAVPALLVPLLLGALAPDERTAGPSATTPVRERALVTGLLLFVSLGILRTGMEWAAIRHAGADRSTPRLEQALRFDPWNYRIRVMLVQRGSCQQRVRHLRVLDNLLPWHPVVRATRARCPESGA